LYWTLTTRNPTDSIPEGGKEASQTTYSMQDHVQVIRRKDLRSCGQTPILWLA
jgi:hypothetical protein